MPLVEDSFTSQISARLRKTILDCDSWMGNLTFAANITTSGTYLDVPDFTFSTNVPEVSAKNLVNVNLCQHYPSVLHDLTPVKECWIAKCHPVGIVLKLRPGGHSSPISSPISYRAVRGPFIVIPQDPKPLLRILPSPELSLDNLIRFSRQENILLQIQT